LELKDTLVLKSQSNPSFGEKVERFFGIDSDQEIRNLKETVGYQQELIEQLSSMATEPTVVIKTVPNLDETATASLKKDAAFLEDLPSSYSDLPRENLEKITKEINKKIAELTEQRDSLLRTKGNEELISAKNNIISSLEREKNVINLSGKTADLQDENGVLNTENGELKIKENKLKRYLYASLIALALLVLLISVFLQRKAIRRKDGTIEDQFAKINKKNTYLEYAARLIRHDMHSGINTYMPRGISGLEKRLTPEEIEASKLDTAFKMLKEGLAHTQRVYKSVYEFTNIVKKNVVLERKKVDLTELINNFVSATSYSSQVELGELIEAEVNPTLFCNAVDNLIKNGLKYNDSQEKRVWIYMKDEDLIIQDNGRGLEEKEFEKIRSAHAVGEDAGLGINISIAILEEHGFIVSCEMVENGTKIKIKIKQ
jgi:signal transduction histidine kinase